MHIKNRNTERLKSLKFEIDTPYKCQFPSKWGFSYSNIRKRDIIAKSIIVFQ